MSAVYLGRSVEPTPNEPPRVVALKIVRHDVRYDERMLNMFLEEGRLIARLVHPNIVRTLEVGADAEQDYIAMELMLGKTFAAVHDAIASRDVRLNADIAAWMAARVADALHYAHELRDERGRPLNLVHRDVNPANVFATFNGEVKLFDFGLAKVTGTDHVGSSVLAGKLSYLSPEQVMQLPLDRRSDVFSLGTTLWELLTSRRLFRRDSDIETVRAVQLGPIPDPRLVAPEIPEELARIAKTALERNRDHRYPSAAHLAHDLDTYLYRRTSPAEVTARIAQLVDTLFPGEQKRQQGWLKPAISPSTRNLSSITPSQVPIPNMDAVPSFVRERTPQDGVPLHRTTPDGSLSFADDAFEPTDHAFPAVTETRPPSSRNPAMPPPPSSRLPPRSVPPTTAPAPPRSIPPSMPPATAPARSAPPATTRSVPPSMPPPTAPSRSVAPPSTAPRTMPPRTMPPRATTARPMPPTSSAEDISRTDLQPAHERPKTELKPMAVPHSQRPKRAPIPLPSRVGTGSIPPPPRASAPPPPPRTPVRAKPTARDTDPPKSDTQTQVDPPGHPKR
jgi:eukaryotic-like serine/threonine-protein kinase